jgi:hypothetical protein
MTTSDDDDSFRLATTFVSTRGSGLPPEVLLQLYGAFKCATTSEAPPPAGFLSSFSRDGAKRAAWESTARVLAASPLPAGVSLSSVAKARYVALLDAALPQWRAGHTGECDDDDDDDDGDAGSDGGGGEGGGGGGAAALGLYVLSRPLAAPEPTGDTLAALKRDLHFCCAKGLAAELTAALAALGPAAAVAAVNTPLSPSGETLLHVAADAGSGGAVAALLAAGAAVDAREPGGSQTALHYACALGHWEAAGALLAGGADAALRDADGGTAGCVADAGLPPHLRARLLLAEKE